MNEQQLEPHTTADQPEPRPTPQARPQAAQTAQTTHHASRPHASQTRPTAQARRHAQAGHRPKTEHARAKAMKAPKEKPQGGRSRYLPALDGIRALAVVAVVLYHLNFTWIQGGLLGVTMFFVISGYIITRLL